MTCRINRKRKIMIRNFHGEGKHLYEDELGWPLYVKKEAGSMVSREIFKDQVEDVGFNLGFYYVDDDTFYGIHRERHPIECKVLPRDKKKRYIGEQCDGDTHPNGIVIATFDDEKDIWDNFKIDGKSLEYVLSRSYIMFLN